MKFPFVCKSSQETSSSSAWPWPSCAANSRTHSFRADDDDTENRLSDYDHIDEEEMIISSSKHRESSIKAGLRSERLFFEPGNTNSILEEAKKADDKKSVACCMEIESRDPVLDFRVSMEEMVGAHGLKDWESLEKLLACYLRVNGKKNHAYIIGAFVDLLFSDSSSSSSSPPLSFSSSSSTYSSACNLSKYDDEENGSCYSTCNASSSSSGV